MSGMSGMMGRLGGMSGMSMMGGMSGMQSLFSFGSNGYMLLYRKVDPIRNQNEPSKEIIPEILKSSFIEDNERRKLEVEEKLRDKEMITLRVNYKDNMKQLKIHRDKTVAEAKTMAKKEFGLENISDDCVRLRDIQYDIPAKPIKDETISLDDMRFYPVKTLIMETREVNEEFPIYDPTKLLLKLYIYDEEKEKWGDMVSVYVEKDGKLNDLKKIVQEKSGLDLDDQILTIERYNRYNAKVLIKNKYIRKDYRIEGKKVWVERKDPLLSIEDYKYDKYGRDSKTKQFPKSFTEINRLKNIIEIKFNDLQSTEPTHTIKVDKNITLLQLKKLIQEKINLDLDEFIVYKGSERYKSELKNEDNKLSEYHFTSLNQLFIEKGKPMRKGEIVIKFYTATIIKEGYELGDLFKLALPEKNDNQRSKS